MLFDLPFELGYSPPSYLLALESMAFLHYVSLKIVETDNCLKMKLPHRDKLLFVIVSKKILTILIVFWLSKEITFINVFSKMYVPFCTSKSFIHH